MAALEETISRYMRGDQTDEVQSWTLSEPGRTETRVTLSWFKESPFCNIRVFVEDKASKQGVTLNESHWSSLRTILGCGDEIKLGRELYAEMLNDLIRDLRSTRCEGCVRDWPSQKDHECLQGLTLRIIAEKPSVDPFEFQFKLAEKARDKRLRLSNPSEIYEVCATLLRSSIEQELTS